MTRLFLLLLTLLFSLSGQVMAEHSNFWQSSLAANSAPTRVFWSGGDKMRETAEAWAKANNATTLEMTTAGQRLTTTTKGLDWLTEARPMWAQESSVFAKGAHGDVHVFQWNSPQSLENMTIWREFEFPVLKQQGNNINYHLIDP